MAARNGMAASMLAEATLRASGGSSVTVCACVPGNDSGNTGLGIGPAMQQEWQLEPAVVRWKSANDEKYREMVVSATTIEHTLKTSDTETLRGLLLRSQVKLSEETLRVAGVSTEVHEGTVYLYRLRLER